MRIPSFTAPGKKGSNNAESDNRYCGKWGRWRILGDSFAWGMSQARLFLYISFLQSFEKHGRKYAVPNFFVSPLFIKSNDMKEYV